MAAREEYSDDEVETELSDRLKSLSVAERWESEQEEALELVHQAQLSQLSLENSFLMMTPERMFRMVKVSIEEMRDASIPMADGDLFFHSFVFQIFPMSAFCQGAERFGDITDSNLRSVAAAHNILATSLCNYGFGSLEVMPEGTSKSSKMWRRGSVYYPKVYILIETLVAEYFSEPATEDNIGYAVGENKIIASKTFQNKNVVGFKVWYFVIDPELDVNSCILRGLQDRINEQGEGPRPIYWPERYENAPHNLKVMFADAIQSYSKQAKIHNDLVNRQLNAIDKKKEKRSRALKKKEVNTYLNEREMHWIITEPLGLQTEIVSWYAGVKPMTRAEGQYFVGSNTEISAKSAYWKQYLDFEKIFGYENTYPNRFVDIINRKGEHVGVNAVQLGSYFDDQGFAITFPYPDLCFNIEPHHADPEFFYFKKMPWKVSELETYLQVAEQFINDIREHLKSGYTSSLFRRFKSSTQKIFTKLQKQHAAALKKVGIGSNIFHDSDIKADLIPSSSFYKGYGYSNHKEGTFYEPPSTAVDMKVPPINPVMLKNLTGMARFKAIAPYLSESQRKKFLEVIHNGGFDDFITIISNNTDHTPVVQSAHRHLKDAITEYRAIVYPEIPLFAKYGVSNSFLVSDLIRLRSMGFSRDYMLVYEIMIAYFRAASLRRVEKEYGAPGGIHHFLLVGPPAQGKTYMIQAIKDKLCLPETVMNRTSQSEHAMETSEDTSGGLVFLDELNPSTDKKSASADSSKNCNVNTLKVVLAEDTNERLICNTKKDKHGNATHRESKLVVSNNRSTHVICANDVVWKHGHDNAIFTRLLVYIIANEANFKMSKISEKMVIAFANDWNNFGGDFSLQDNIRARDRHALNVMAWHLIASSGLPFPSLNIFYALWGTVSRMLTDFIPSLTTEIRYWMQIISIALGVTVDNAIHIVFFSPLSPFIRGNISRNTYDILSFQYDHLKMLKYYLIMHEDAAITVIMRFVHQHVYPEYLYKAAYLMAVFYCGWKEKVNPNERQEDIKFSTCNIMHGGKSVVLEDRNYVEFHTDYKSVLGFLAKQLAINEDTATIIFTKLLSLRIKAVVSQPVVSDTAVSTPFQSNIIDVFQQHVSNNGTGTTTFKISTFFLVHCTPEKIYNRVLKALQYKGIREREVVIGIPHPQCDYLLRKVNLVSGAHALKIRTPESSSHKMFDSINPDMLSTEGSSFQKFVAELQHTHVKPISDSSVLQELDTDAETYFADRFLRLNFALDNYSQYYPKTLQSHLEKFSTGYNNISVQDLALIANYPESFLPRDEVRQFVDDKLLFRPEDFGFDPASAESKKSVHLKTLDTTKPFTNNPFDVSQYDDDFGDLDEQDFERIEQKSKPTTLPFSSSSSSSRKRIVVDDIDEISETKRFSTSFLKSKTSMIPPKVQEEKMLSLILESDINDLEV